MDKKLRAEVWDLEARVDGLRERYAALDGEIQSLLNDLRVFKGLYYARVGRHLLERDEAEYGLRRRLFLAREMLRSAGESDLTEALRRFEEAHRDERLRLEASREESKEDFVLFERLKTDERLEDPQSLAECRALYVKLARYFHPDLHHLDPRVKTYSLIMAKVNERYSERDLAGLREIDDGVIFKIEIKGETLTEHFERLQRIEDRIKECMDKRLDELNAIREDELCRLMERWRREGGGFLDELEEAARMELESFLHSTEKRVDALVTNIDAFSQTLGL